MGIPDLYWQIFFVIFSIILAIGGYIVYRPDIILEPPDISQGWIPINSLIKIKNNGKVHTTYMRGFIRYFKEGKRQSTHEIIYLRDIESLAKGEEKILKFSFFEGILQYDMMEIVLIYTAYPWEICYQKVSKYHIIRKVFDNGKDSVCGLKSYGKSKTDIILRMKKTIKRYTTENSRYIGEKHGKA